MSSSKIYLSTYNNNISTYNDNISTYNNNIRNVLQKRLTTSSDFLKKKALSKKCTFNNTSQSQCSLFSGEYVGTQDDGKVSFK